MEMIIRKTKMGREIKRERERERQKHEVERYIDR